jgi:hypothetical protein
MIHCPLLYQEIMMEKFVTAIIKPVKSEEYMECILDQSRTSLSANQKLFLIVYLALSILTSIFTTLKRTMSDNKSLLHQVEDSQS